MYDDFTDRLFISCKKNSEEISGSIRVLNLIIDFTFANKVANVELKKASYFLKSIGINPKILNKLTSADIMLKQCRDGYLIYFILRAKNQIERIPYNIQSKKMPLLTNS